MLARPTRSIVSLFSRSERRLSFLTQVRVNGYEAK